MLLVVVVVAATATVVLIDFFLLSVGPILHADSQRRGCHQPEAVRPHCDQTQQIINTVI